MPAHGKPDPAFRFRTAHEIEALDAHFDLRNVPLKSDDTLMLACWTSPIFAFRTVVTMPSRYWPTSAAALI
ncbi:hypothetical protein N9Q54_02035 [Octadecabacter sp.]|nr:hypothetical protein [Octadecabacter sp.]MDB4052708.1 hypothetical protein [Octadecabacter sp.]